MKPLCCSFVCFIYLFGLFYFCDYDNEFICPPATIQILPTALCIGYDIIINTTINYIFGMMTSLALRPQVVVSAGEDAPCVCHCEHGLNDGPVSCAIISIPPTPLGLGYDIIIMSSCYSSSAPCIIIHASSSIHPFALQPRSYQPSPPHTQQSTISLG